MLADEVVGATTVAALNVPATERGRQVELNLERWRWLPRDMHLRHDLYGRDARLAAAVSGPPPAGPPAADRPAAGCAADPEGR